MGDKIIWEPVKFVQRVVGFIIGFFFSKPVGSYITDFLSRQTVTIPSQIPSVVQILAGGGIVGIILLIIAVIMGIKFITKMATFIIWVLLGVLVALVITALGFQIPDPIAYLKGLF